MGFLLHKDTVINFLESLLLRNEFHVWPNWPNNALNLIISEKQKCFTINLIF